MFNTILFVPSRIAPELDSQTPERDLCLRRLYLPICTSDGSLSVFAADNSAENLSWLHAAYPLASVFEISKARLFAEFSVRFGALIADDAVNGLARSSPTLSARTVMTGIQALSFGVVIAIVAAACINWPGTACGALAVLMSLGFVGGALFRALLAWLGGRPSNGATSLACEDFFLPVYTILVPLYREANVLPRLIRSLLLLDYPHELLDIKLIVEKDDTETAAVADAMAERGPFEVIRVPAGAPRTKPRACNYAFKFARGEFTVIYDAEDRPERDQLRKAVQKFRTGPRDVACLQARLNFYNANENWLTRLFALDYALWFDVLLPGLERLGVPMPLGGTSNHFRTSVLNAIGAWDPFNVTEDADLGIRISQHGSRVAMLDSTTFEEAPTRLYSWLKQRSRWLKGYMQTWLVHMRDPRALQRRIGWRGFFAFQLFLGGSVLAALVNPLLWLVFLASSAFHPPALDTVPNQLAAIVSVAGLVIGNAAMTGLALIAPKRRGWKGFAPYGLTATFYWALISVAAYRGLWQLATKPFHWDKTVHGQSRMGLAAR